MGRKAKVPSAPTYTPSKHALPASARKRHPRQTMRVKRKIARDPEFPSLAEVDRAVKQNKFMHLPGAKKGKCNYPRRHLANTPCMNPAGMKTDHPGQGRCYLHGGAANVIHGRYSQINRRDLTETIARLREVEEDVMDLTPEVELLRSITIDFINRYDEFFEALLAWHANDSKTKPRKIVDIADAYRIIEAVGRTVERMHKIQTTGAISLETFRRVTEAMGLVVAKHVSDQQALRYIEAEWGSISLEAKTEDELDRVQIPGRTDIEGEIVSRDDDEALSGGD